MTLLTGKRILIVEDEPIIAMTVEDIILEMGGIPVGPAANLAEGLRLAADPALDAALLDVNLNGDRSDAIAHHLDGIGVPYVFATGYGRNGVEGFPDAHVIAKPYSAETLSQLLAKVIAA